MMGRSAGDVERWGIDDDIVLKKEEKEKEKAEEKVVEVEKPKAVARVALAKVETMRQKEKVEEKE